MVNEADKLHELIQNIWKYNKQEERDPALKEIYEQYYTSAPIANYMASLFNSTKKRNIKILDPGAGLGSLTIAFVLATFEWSVLPKNIHAVLYEIDTTVKQQLESVMEELTTVCTDNRVNFTWEVRFTNFIKDGVTQVNNMNSEIFDYIILNPPYRKMETGSLDDKLLLNVGIDSSNYYAAFVSLAKRFLLPKGEIVTITPRSFCNGVYFYKFRKDIKLDLRFSNIHLFDSRTSAFSKDDVLQETIICHFIKEKWEDNKKVRISHSSDDTFSDTTTKILKLDELIYPTDRNMTIRIAKNDEDREISNLIESLPCTHSDLDIEISTGPVVDFREKQSLLNKEVSSGSSTFLSAYHIKGGIIRWPLSAAKYNSLIPDKENMKRLRPLGNYVLVKRVSSKEEKRRIVAAVVEGEKFNGDFFAFDNKTNYFHRNKNGIELKLAIGICIYINSSIVDMYFRTFSGHTQVNATDLRSIRYPSKNILEKLGKHGLKILLKQQDIDSLVERIVFSK